MKKLFNLEISAVAHKLWLQYAQMLSNHCNSRKLVSAIFSRLFWNITCLDLECKQCTLELDIMYYSAMANCPKHTFHTFLHILFVSGRVVCQQYVILKLACRTRYPLTLRYASWLRPPRHKNYLGCSVIINIHEAALLLWARFPDVKQLRTHR